VTAATIKQQYQDEEVARSYDRKRFSGVVGTTFDALEKRAIGRLVAVVCREVPLPRVLDVPCGTGRITEYLLNRGLEVSGGDVSEAMLSIARPRCARFGTMASFSRLDLDCVVGPDEGFDLVTCIRLFHHLETEDRGRILRQLARVSRHYVLANFSLASPYYRMRRRVKRMLGQGVSSASSTRDDIEREARSAGLRVAKQRLICPWASENVVVLFEKDRPLR
jgi:ubiquinone/menaquinone biosynthesis C-methylase UbiE